MCVAHYSLWRKHGDPQHKQRPTFGMTPEQAFRHYMPGDPPTDGSCWEWTGTKAHPDQPYPTFRSGGRAHRVNRFAYQYFVGPIPAGMLIRHRCDNPQCCNPTHLEPGTDADNNRDMMIRRRNRQPHGERQGSAKLTEENVLAIRARYAAGGISQQSLADEYGVDQTCISTVVLRKNWKHL